MTLEIKFKVMCWSCDFRGEFYSLNLARECANKHATELSHGVEIKPFGYEIVYEGVKQ